MKWLLPVLFLFHAVSPVLAAPPAKKPQPTQAVSLKKNVCALPITNRSWKGDFDEMMERRLIRLLVPYSRTLYYSNKGQISGITAEMARNLEKSINSNHLKKLDKRPIVVAIIPTSRDKLLPGIITGLGDIAAANLTVTDERLQLVDIVSPIHGRSVSEVIVTGPGVKPLTRVEELSGRRIYVRKSASYFESIVQLNKRFQQENRAEIKLVPVPNSLEDEDMMEMVNAGVLEMIVMDDWKADIWRKVLPKLIINKQFTIQTGIRKGWAVRKKSPLLTAELIDFFDSGVTKQNGIEYRVVKSNRSFHQICNPVDLDDWKRFERMYALFRKYGDQYGFDPLMLAALGYQESRLLQNARGSFGAVGVMQLLPATGAAMKVGNINILESNIQAGAKYMHYLLKQYFQDADFSEPDRTLFAIAAYNAGPARITKIRKEAAKSGLDPDQWFNHVEMVTAQKIGMDTTIYVRNIYKYFVAYTLAFQAQEQRNKAREK